MNAWNKPRVIGTNRSWVRRLFIRSTSQPAGLLLKTQGSAVVERQVVWMSGSWENRKPTASRSKRARNGHCTGWRIAKDPRKRGVLRILKREPEATRSAPVPDGHMTSLIRTRSLGRWRGTVVKEGWSHVIHAPLWCRVPRSASLMNSTRNKVKKQMYSSSFLVQISTAWIIHDILEGT